MFTIYRIPKGFACLISTRRQLKKLACRTLGLTSGRQWTKHKKRQQRATGIRFNDMPVQYLGAK